MQSVNVLPQPVLPRTATTPPGQRPLPPMPAMQADRYLAPRPAAPKPAPQRQHWYEMPCKWAAAVAAGIGGFAVGFVAPVAALEFTIGAVAAAPLLSFLVPPLAIILCLGAGAWAFQGVGRAIRGR